MRSPSVGYHTVNTGFLPILAGAIVALSGNSADALVCTRGVNAPASTPDTTPSLAGESIWRPDPQEEIQWDQEILLFLQVICIILQCPPQQFSVETEAATTAQGIIDRYRTDGLLPNLTPEEITNGLEGVMKCQRHLRFGAGTPGSLSTGLAGELDQTFTDMINELRTLQDSTARSAGK